MVNICADALIPTLLHLMTDWNQLQRTWETYENTRFYILYQYHGNGQYLKVKVESVLLISTGTRGVHISAYIFAALDSNNFQGIILVYKSWIISRL